MNLIINTKVSVNPDGNFVTTTTFSNGQTLSWFENILGQLDVIFTGIIDKEDIWYLTGIEVPQLNHIIVRLLKR